MKIQSVRGVSDILPENSFLWQYVITKAREVFCQFNYQEIIIPIIEDAKLFNRSLGADSEVVDKQMFIINRQDDTLALRPEGTAGVVRAYLEHSLDRKNPFVKLYYVGPMFRAERPQKGRLRQFNHIGAEVIGSNSPFIDAEIICLASGILESLGISGFGIRLNSLGSREDKLKLSKLLRKLLEPQLKSFCGDCQNRFERNVFRLLDCKNESCQKQVKSLNINPDDYLSQESINHFEVVRKTLDAGKINYQYDPFLVRGLDYYTNTVFEINHPKLGAQDAIGAGGRYNNLVKELGGSEAGAIGFALGVERLMLALEENKDKIEPEKLDLFIAALGEAAVAQAFTLANELRKAGISVEVDYENRRLDKKIARASKLGAKYLGIIGEDELINKNISLKNLETGEQEAVSFEINSIRKVIC